MLTRQAHLQFLIFVTICGAGQLALHMCSGEDAIKSLGDQDRELLELRSGFFNPPNSAKPWVIWFWWNGVLSQEEVERELEEIADAGFGGAEIRCVTFRGWGGTPLSQMDPASLRKLGHQRFEYLSDEFLEVLEATFTKAEQLDLKLSLNMGQGWPPGGPWIQQEHRSKLLKIDSQVLEGPAHYRLPDKTAATEVYSWKISSESSDQVIPSSFVDVRKQVEDQTAEELNWAVPPGQWLIGEFSVQPGGICDKGDGPEVDPGSKEAVLYHLDHFFGRIDPVLGRFYGSTLEDVASDSWEYAKGHSRYWSNSLPDYFLKLNGYDLKNRLHALIGYGPNKNSVLSDLEDAERELVHENFFVTVANFLQARGLLHRSQPYGRGLARDYFQAYATVDTPEIEQGVVLPEAAWVSHTLGHKITSAEAFTFISKKHRPIRSLAGSYETTPWLLRSCGNYMFSEGINRLHWHSFSYSPPALLPPGWRMYTEVHLNRNIPWWPYISPLTGWMSRIQHVLQAGSPVADVLVYPVKSNPLEEPYGDYCEFQPVSASNCIDGANFHTLPLIRERIASGEYNCQALCLLRDISDRVEAEHILAIAQRCGKLVCCNALPQDWQVMKNSGDSDELSGRITRLLNDCVVIDARESGWRDALITEQKVGWQPHHKELKYQHRKLNHTDIYFLANFGDDFEGAISFPIKNRRVEIWNAETGEMRAAPVGSEQNGQISISLSLRHADSTIIAFVPGEWPVRAMDSRDARFLFDEDDTLLASITSPGRHAATLSDQSVKYFDIVLPDVINLNEPWSLRLFESTPPLKMFQDQLVLDKLVSWREIPQFKNFAGTLSYKTSFRMNHDMFTPNLRWSLDLGKVYEVAQVLINGQRAGEVLYPPYRTDVTKFLKPGVNMLEVRVANLLKNHLSTSPNYDRPSGILGPVRLHPECVVKVSDNN